MEAGLVAFFGPILGVAVLAYILRHKRRKALKVGRFQPAVQITERDGRWRRLK